MNHMKLPILTPFEPTKVAVSYGSSDIGSYLPVSLQFWGLEVNEYIPFLNRLFQTNEPHHGSLSEGVCFYFWSRLLLKRISY